MPSHISGYYPPKQYNIHPSATMTTSYVDPMLAPMK